MAVLSIRELGDPVLREKARPVARVTRRHQRLIEDMKETMKAAGGVGLAANQVAVLERIIVADAGNGKILALVNPQIVARWGSDIGVEGCLSIPGVYGYVERSSFVRVHGLDEHGRPKVVMATGQLARILQHEIDHLDGVLFIDRASTAVQVPSEKPASEAG